LWFNFKLENMSKSESAIAFSRVHVGEGNSNAVTIVDRFLRRLVLVKAADGAEVRGVLVACDKSSHGGFGSVILRSEDGPIIVKGNHVQMIGLPAAGANHTAGDPAPTFPDGGYPP
jgi:small nuclear ribonucleoprotein (snRNP)-like protein